MGRERLRNSLRALVVLWAIPPVMGCHTDTEAPGPVPPELYTSHLEIRAHCSVWFELELGKPLGEELVLPNPECVDHSDLEDAHPNLGIPPSSPEVVVLSIRNLRTTPVTLTSIAFETDPAPAPSSNRTLDELVEFRERYDECLVWLSDPPTGATPGSVLLAPRTLQPGETCYAELARIVPSMPVGSTATGSVVFFGPSSTELARLPIQVAY